MNDNYIIKVKSGYYHNITYVQDECIELDMSLINPMDIIYPMSIEFIDESKIFDIFKFKSVLSVYIGKSRVDGSPMFRIDPILVIRNDKILNIIDV
jgi:hypothetical protein